MLAGLYAAALARGEQPEPVPRATGLGSLVHYITHADPKHFQPANITFDLLQPLEEELRRKIRDKRERHKMQCERSLAQFDAWWQRFSGSPVCNSGSSFRLSFVSLPWRFLLPAQLSSLLRLGQDGHKIINRVAVESVARRHAGIPAHPERAE